MFNTLRAAVNWQRTALWSTLKVWGTVCLSTFVHFCLRLNHVSSVECKLLSTTFCPFLSGRLAGRRALLTFWQCKCTVNIQSGFLCSWCIVIIPQCFTVSSEFSCQEDYSTGFESLALMSHVSWDGLLCRIAVCRSLSFFTCCATVACVLPYLCFLSLPLFLCFVLLASPSSHTTPTSVGNQILTKQIHIILVCGEFYARHCNENTSNLAFFNICLCLAQ